MLYIGIYFSVSLALALVGLYGSVNSAELSLLKKASQERYYRFLVTGFVFDILLSPVACTVGLVQSLRRK